MLNMKNLKFLFKFVYTVSKIVHTCFLNLFCEIKLKNSMAEERTGMKNIN